MKIFLLLSLIFLAACAVQPLTSTQNVVDMNNEVEVNVSQNVTLNATQSQNVTLPPVQEVKPIPLPKYPVTISSVNGSNVYLINKTVHRIEVVDVTEDETGCLIKVDNTIVLINEDSEQRVNGIKIHVLDVRAFRSQLKDNDVCQVIII